MTVGISSANMATPILNLFRSVNATAPAGCFLKLHTADPGATGATAPAAGSTTRVTVAFAAPGVPTANQIAMTGTPPVWTNGGTNETLSHISAWDTITAGLFDWSAALTTPQAWVATNTFTLNTLTITLAPIAA